MPPEDDTEQHLLFNAPVENHSHLYKPSYQGPLRALEGLVLSFLVEQVFVVMWAARIHSCLLETLIVSFLPT